MAVTSGHDTARLALHNAEVALRRADHAASGAWLHAAVEECAAWLAELDGGFRLWPEWRRFLAACEQRPDVYDRRLGWRGSLQRSVAAALRAFGELELAVAHRRAPDNLQSRLAVALEDLLDQVWACEREWDFDDRVLGS